MRIEAGIGGGQDLGRRTEAIIGGNMIEGRMRGSITENNILHQGEGSIAHVVAALIEEAPALPAKNFR